MNTVVISILTLIFSSITNIIAYMLVTRKIKK